MSTKIEKVPPQSSSWGENIFALATARQLGSEKLVREAEEAVEKRYRLEIRDRFVQDARVSRALEESRDCLLNDGTYESVFGLVKDIVREGTEEIFNLVLRELLVELDAMQKAEPTAYLIDRRDGKVIMPITDREIYTPPDYTDEAGIVHQSRPMLHPAVAAPLMMKQHETGRRGEAIERATLAGKVAAVEHLIQGPDVILERARTLLRSQNVEVEDPGGLTDEKRETATIEVGRERVDDMLQAPNYNFHRSQMYGSLLAKKVMDLLRDRRRCDLKHAVLRKGSKEQWYEVTVDFVL